MSEQMQQAEEVLDNPVTEEVQDTETVTEEVTETEATAEDAAPKEEEPVVFDDRQQAKVNDLIGKKVGETHKERELRLAAEARIRDLEARIPKPQQPAIPPRPTDTFSETYDQDLDAWSEAVKSRAEFDAAEKVRRENAAAYQQHQATQQKQDINKKITAYRTNAEASGLNADTAEQQGEALVRAGISGDVAFHILEDPKGAEIVNHLMSNPVELDNVLSMSPLRAALHIENTVKASLKPARKTTTAPAPPDLLSGGGKPPKKRGAAGAIFK